jgi:hypothetical protein
MLGGVIISADCPPMTRQAILDVHPAETFATPGEVSALLVVSPVLDR